MFIIWMVELLEEVCCIVILLVSCWILMLKNSLENILFGMLLCFENRGFLSIIMFELL